MRRISGPASDQALPPPLSHGPSGTQTSHQKTRVPRPNMPHRMPIIPASVSCQKKRCTRSSNRVPRASKRRARKPINSKPSTLPGALISSFRSLSLPLLSCVLGADLSRRDYLRRRICLLLQHIYSIGMTRTSPISCSHNYSSGHSQQPYNPPNMRVNHQNR